MLPGFRFLFAAILLSTSVLVFGLGAAALLRAAHEEVANIPARRAPPERVFTQPNDPPPTLAMVRLEPLAAKNVLRPRTRPQQSNRSQKQQRPPSPKCRPLWNRKIPRR